MGPTRATRKDVLRYSSGGDLIQGGTTIHQTVGSAVTVPRSHRRTQPRMSPIVTKLKGDVKLTTCAV
jgi:hypothetical protein